ncbi:MAG TPA: hypothetical protein PKI77_17815, partial [Mycobacterium sp.]|nr:hypothetical protein [Mycobacterium sp.]
GLPVVASDIPAHRELVSRAGPAAAARLGAVAEDADGAEAGALFADAIAEQLSTTASRSERAQRCTLPRTADMVRQLVDTLTAASAMVSLS